MLPELKPLQDLKSENLTGSCNRIKMNGDWNTKKALRLVIRQVHPILFILRKVNQIVQSLKEQI